MLLISSFFPCSATNYGINAKSMQRRCLQIRNSVLPKPPKTANEILEVFKNADVMEKYGMTDRENESTRSTFYKHAFQCDEFQCCIFCSDDVVTEMIQNIEETSRIFMIDGTFKITPFGEFVQVVIISVVFLGQVRVL